jgi:tripartite-type tricarboxylate transporter receptor subunit TctC
MTLIRIAAIALIVLGAGEANHAAVAQTYASKPVKLVVPYPAGGPNDIIARILAQKLTEGPGGNFFVENTGSVRVALSPWGRWRMRRPTAPPFWSQIRI